MELDSGVTRRTGQSGSLEVFQAFLKLGLTSFGGPVAHLGYFRQEFVARRKWLDEAWYADIVALLPVSAGTGKQPGWPRDRLVAGRVSRRARRLDRLQTVALLLFFGLLLALPLAASTGSGLALQLFDSFYRAGSLVFAGGHVVLPLLQAEVVPRGWVRNDAFLARYGAAQAVPGPLFTFAAYLGVVIGGWHTGVLCLIAVFLPSFLLVIGTLPFWEQFWHRVEARGLDLAHQAV